ncbi:phage tail protein, partial [Embleya sp. NPDC059267]
ALLRADVEAIDSMVEVFDPWTAPAPFLDWLATITGARVESGWTEEQRRAAIDLAPLLNARRGTRAGLDLEARVIHGWTPTVVDPGQVRTDTTPWSGGRTLLVSLPEHDDQADSQEVEQRLARLVRAHCPAHVPYRVHVPAASGPARSDGSSRTEPTA